MKWASLIKRSSDFPNPSGEENTTILYSGKPIDVNGEVRAAEKMVEVTKDANGKDVSLVEMEKETEKLEKVTEKDKEKGFISEMTEEEEESLCEFFDLTSDKKIQEYYEEYPDLDADDEPFEMMGVMTLDISNELAGMAASYAYNLGVQGQMADWLINTGKNYIDAGLVATGIKQCLGNVESIKNNLTGLKQAMGAFSFNSEDVLGSLDGILVNADGMVTKVENIVQSGEELLNFVTEQLPEKIENIGNFVEEKVEQINKLFESISDGTISEKISQAVENLPETVANGLLQMDIVQDVLAVPKRIYSTCIGVVATLSSIKHPTCLKDLHTIISQLRSMIAQIRTLKDSLMGTYERIKGLYDKIANGQILDVAFQMISGQLRFIEIPPAYNAQYPHNVAHKSNSGHIIEEDDTPGKERLHWEHKTGTKVEMNQEGQMAMKAKSDLQVNAGKNAEMHGKENVNITAQKAVSIEGDVVDIHSKNGPTTISGPSINIVGDPLKGVVTINGYAVNIVGLSSLTMTGALGSNVSSPAPVMVSSNTNVTIKAPTISLLSEGGITMAAGGAISMKAGGGISTMAGGMISEMAGGMMSLKAGANMSLTAATILLN